LRRVWLRAAALAVVVVCVVVGLTVYFSSEDVPLCGVSGAPRWNPPGGSGTYRYEVVLPDRAACFYAIDDDLELVGALRLPAAAGISSVNPNLSDLAVRGSSGVHTLDLRTGRLRNGGLSPYFYGIVTAPDTERHVLYVTRPRRLGFQVLDLRTGRTVYDIRFRGFTWNPRFGPNPPSHGLSLAPDRPELWVLDAPNSTVHVFDVSAVPAHRPRPVEDIRLSKPLSGDRSPCSRACRRLGSLQHSSDGRYVYVGDAGDVIDTNTRERVKNLPALHNSRVHLEVVFSGGRPSYPHPG
jgi:hypothetical protein